MWWNKEKEEKEKKKVVDKLFRVKSNRESS